jgi:hypothetical protein
MASQRTQGGGRLDVDSYDPYADSLDRPRGRTRSYGDSGRRMAYEDSLGGRRGGSYDDSRGGDRVFDARRGGGRYDSAARGYDDVEDLTPENGRSRRDGMRGDGYTEGRGGARGGRRSLDGGEPGGERVRSYASRCSVCGGMGHIADVCPSVGAF